MSGVPLGCRWWRKAASRWISPARGRSRLAACCWWEALGLFVSDWFHLVSAAVGAFLVFGGLTGQVSVVQVLRQMPWNRRFLSALSARA